MTDSNNHPPLVKSLMSGDAYPHPVEKIELLETHISWILLTGKYAYKVKKPVELGFLDFSTLSQRQHFCEEELRLNRRFSKDLYLDVVSIKQFGTQLKVTEEEGGQTVEYAVRMHQFSQAEQGNEMLKSGRLTHVEFNDFAESLAQFHHQAGLAPIKGTDPDSTVHHPALENFRHLNQVDWDDGMRQSLDEIQAWTTSTYHDHSGIFRQRSQDGFVRDCHGDLHLGNIVWWNERLTPFDCLEFNEQLRQIDVMSEIAFLIMDLDDHQRSGFARSFLNSYLEQTGDYSGLRILTFYLVYRSMVRAKVAAIRLEQGHLSPEECDDLKQECHSYIKLAHQYTQAKTPSLAITCGLSGSGKTTGSESLVREDAFVRIRSDVERKRVFGLNPLDRSSNEIATGLYSQSANAKTEERLLAAATDALQAGFSVIVDATFLKQEQRRPFMQLAKEKKVSFRICHFEAAHDVLRQRVQQRRQLNSDASDATVDVLEHQIKIQEPFSTEEEPFVEKSSSRKEESNFDA
ncbi:bifunctional aminoglycoside phosphotransferase/ATP-binding protein [Thalassoglobus polymorphus]|uniref:bifunctional aminoglycoside phosphotransferase/ATP-binding protein n=1 Tax=Thalassoglobus polymorphus TaxID=2527994 RepID=UPI0018D25650|nr:bifunctional aminoglycoside phosphotransferase/ATP-binding protein [Thalassoglobus polymorphus]